MGECIEVQIRVSFFVSLIFICSFLFLGCNNSLDDGEELSKSEVTEVKKIEKPIEEVPIQSVEEKVVPPVLDGAKEFDGHLYKIFTFWTTWDDAQQFCQSVGGHLATAESEEECNIMQKMIEESSTKGFGYWLGAKRDSRGLWKWTDGEIINYSRWAENHPYDIDTYERMTIWGNGEWFARPSKLEIDDKYLIICEWDSVKDVHDTNF